MSIGRLHDSMMREQLIADAAKVGRDGVFTQALTSRDIQRYYLNYVCGGSVLNGNKCFAHRQSYISHISNHLARKGLYGLLILHLHLILDLIYER